MHKKRILKLVALIAIVLSSSLSLKAQDPQETAEMYNWAIKNYKQNLDAAIDTLERFEEASTMLLESGELEGKVKEQMEMLREKSHKYLPSLYYKSAITLYKQMRTDMAIDRFERTIDVANKYDNKGIVKKAEDLLPKLYFKLASEAMNMMDYQKAIENYTKVIEYDPAWAGAYLKKALAYQKEDNEAQMISTLGQAMKVAKEVDDNKTLRQAKTLAQTYYWQKGASNISNSQNEEALNSFRKALEIDSTNHRAHYYVALAKNKLFKYKEAIKDSEKALNLLGEDGDKEEKAMLWLQMGIAYGSLGKKEQGCEYLKKAEYGKTASKAKKEQDSFGCSY